MARPDARPLRKLPTLAARHRELETCVFCPKLCRTACPVSAANAAPTETLTPWGKMSMAYFAATDAVPLETSFTQPVWGCTDCGACTGLCDHKNPVGDVLREARAAVASAGLAPDAARRVRTSHGARMREASEALARLADDEPDAVSASSDVALVLGCSYARKLPAAARAAVRATARLVGGPVRLVNGCCGLPLADAGDALGAEETASAMVRATRDARLVVTVDAGCAQALARRDPRPSRLHFAELAAREIARVGQVTGLGEVRWHDPCKLGRGLGVFDEPRAVLTKALGAPPGELERTREHAACSGAGALLPLTMPEVATSIAKDRADEHTRAGGGTLVTACASSLRAFRKAGLRALDLAEVVDLATREPAPGGAPRA